MTRTEYTDRLTEVDKEEQRQLEVLFNSRQAALHNPEVLKLQRDRQEMINAAERENAWTFLFRTPIKFNGVWHTADDTISNRGEIQSWLDETKHEQISSEWFAKTISEQPNLAKQISFSRVLSLQQQRQQDQEHTQAAKERFAQICRVHKIAENQSNLALWLEHQNDPITWLEGRPMILTADDQLNIDLVPAGNDEQQKWEQQKFEKHQAHLRELRAAASSDNPLARANATKELRQISVADRTQTFQDTAQLYQEYDLLRGFVQRGESTLPALPERWNGQVLDGNYIRKNIIGNRDQFKTMIARHGLARVNARLFDLNEDFFQNAAAKLQQLELRINGVHSFAL